MKWLFWRQAPEVLLVLALIGTGGCDPTSNVKAGPPVLQSFVVIDNATGGSLDVTSDGGPVEITGYVHLSALFDRLLDPVPVTGLDGGVDFGTTGAVQIAVAPPLPATATVSYISIYTPNGGPVGLVFASGPGIVTTPDPTFPSGATITATLDGTKVRSKKGEAFTGDGQLVFHTLAFAAAITVPEGSPEPETDGGADAGADAGAPADPDAGPAPLRVMPAMQPVTINFTNVAGGDIASHISVTADRLPFTDVMIGVADGGNPTIYAVTPTTAWPANATIEVTVDATAADAFGAPTGQAVSGSFITSGS